MMRYATLLAIAALLLFGGNATRQGIAGTAEVLSPQTTGGQSVGLGETALDQIASTTKKKKKKKPKTCPTGQNRDPNTGKCFSCSHNDHFDATLGKCVPCKPGFHEEVQADDNGEDQNVCVADKPKKKSKTKKCANGDEFKDGKCRKSEFPEIENCPEGQNADPQTGVCFSCSHNDHFDPALGKCVPCKQGFHVEGDQCVPD